MWWSARLASTASNGPVPVNSSSETGLEDLAAWRPRIDRNNLITETRNGPGEITVAAPDLEHPSGSRRKLGFDEGRDIHAPPSTTP
jgi:hypothetical protein